MLGLNILSFYQTENQLIYYKTESYEKQQMIYM